MNGEKAFSGDIENPNLQGLLFFDDLKKYGDEMGWKKPFTGTFEKSESEQKLEQIDIVELFEKYSDFEQKIILNNLSSIQFTEGCGGHCNFCFKGPTTNPIAEFSLESIERFFGKYSDYIDNDKGIIMYDHSDPMDRDDFFEISQIVKKHKPDMIESVLSTSMPIGKELNFIDFMKKSFQNDAEFMKGRRFFNNNNDYIMRISLSQHNCIRVEKVIDQLICELLSENFDNKDVYEFINNRLVIEPRFGNYIEQVGELFDFDCDPYKKVISPACFDGVVINPKGIVGIIAVIATKYDPSGEKVFNINPGEVSEKTPKYLLRDDYFGFWTENQLLQKSRSKMVTILPALDNQSEHYVFGGDAEKVCLWMSRECLAMGLNIDELCSLYYYNNLHNYSKKDIKKYLKALEYEYNTRADFQNRILERAEETIEKITDEKAKEKLIYYRDMMAMYMVKVILLNKIAKMTVDKLDFLSFMAIEIQEIGEGEEYKIEDMIEELSNN